ncbi:MAG: nicotinamide-nucleotide amidohydrolase family protein [Clostridia bacterium]|nr:nicotinamide-nucleotide amidohydrolase family protein [Clostridia bacterium]
MKKILLVIDVQKGFITEKTGEQAKERIDALLRAELFDCVISTVYRNYENSPIVRLMGWDKLMTAEEQAVVGEAALRSDHFLEKTTYSACSGELLELLRRENGGSLPEHLFIAGVDTECCVLATATDLFEAGIRPLVLAQYCGASGGEEAHAAGLRSLCSLIGRNNLWEGLIRSAEDLNQAAETARKGGYLPVASTNQKAHRLVDTLAGKGWRISFAESCTGGKAAAGIVDVASASSVFDGSFVTYANEAKVKYLGVSPASIRQYGVVSEQVALEMAIGAARENGAQVGVGISGIAGPTGATPGKPVGMVCFGFYLDGKTFSATRQFGAIGRNAVRDASVAFVYDTLLEQLK